MSYQLLGQGDNQVPITHYYHDGSNTVERQHSKFFKYLDTFLGKIGPPLKLEESWSSSHFFNYGKFPILQDIN